MTFVGFFASNLKFFHDGRCQSFASSHFDFLPPKHLRDAHYKDASKYGFGQGYVYTHDNPDYVQQFMPDEIKNKKYFST